MMSAMVEGQPYEGKPPPAEVWRDLATKILPIFITAALSVGGAYVALSSKVGELSAEVGRLSHLVDRTEKERDQFLLLAQDVKTLKLSIDSINTLAGSLAIRESQVDRDRADLTELRAQSRAITESLTDLKVSIRVLERDVSSLKRDSRRNDP